MTILHQRHAGCSLIAGAAACLTISVDDPALVQQMCFMMDRPIPVVLIVEKVYLWRTLVRQWSVNHA